SADGFSSVRTARRRCRVASSDGPDGLWIDHDLDPDDPGGAKRRSMRVIVIAAGRGRRLMPTTADSPKCFAVVAGKRLIDWAVEAFAANGLNDVCFIGGYQIDRVRRDYPQFTFRHNADWENNNILASLFYAEDLMDEPFICCYSDVLF